MSQPFRNEAGGLIDRGRSFRFTFDEVNYEGHPGDTLASALLANGVRLVGRSFKYHRPRGIFTAGVEEPNALVQLREGATTEPNTRATVAELYDGLTAASQNRWPSLAWDAGAVNDVLGPLFPAGFYYKTFMWPAKAWPLYEAAIRRVAGLGKAPPTGDPDRYDKRFAHADVLVIGGGPAGLAAALAAARCKARVILADIDNLFGGMLLSQPAEIDGVPASDWVAAAVTELVEAETVRLLPRTAVVGIQDHGWAILHERLGDHLGRLDDNQSRQRLWQVRAKRIVLAAGAVERPLVFPGNDRPGVMLAGAARTYLNRYAVRAGEKAVLFTNNDSAYAAALELADGGIAVAGVVDLRPSGSVAGAALRERGIRVLSGEAVIGTTGRKGLREVEVRRLEDGVGGLPQPVQCDLLAVSGGWQPNVHLLRSAAATTEIAAAGACNGAETLDTCLNQGFDAGYQAAADAGKRRRGRERRRPQAAPAPETSPPLSDWFVAGDAKASFVDLQNDVTAADLDLANREGFRSIEHVKRYTTAGMGTDQGKLGNLNVAAAVAVAQGQNAEAVGLTTARPPYVPVTFGAIAGRDLGALLDPVRETPMQSWHVQAGATFEPVGQWLRPRAYIQPGEDLERAVAREVRGVRERAGMLDASTLGKIDIQGPDAAEFLNRIYTNGWLKLAPGRCRYGLMLDEQGMVFDDGVTSRLSPDHFHMTTTSGNAARVLGWLEEFLQTEWPDLKVWCTSVTEQWAVATIAGPLASAILAELAPDLDPDLAHMAHAEATVAGLPARVFRVSFTGGPSYEINVAADHGLALWEAAMRVGAAYGLTPFGTDAMHLLRAEVGFIMVGQETDGTVTPIDLGYEGLVSKTKDFVGKRSLSRPHTSAADRLQLVGLTTRDPRARVPEGAQLVAATVNRVPAPSQGHVTSSYHSPTLNRRICLAMVRRGRERHGEQVNIAFDGRFVPAIVGPPKFFDPEAADG
ncbi:MAG: sarcosine oxidase subunit alpha family protein [Alphaproteobacteria bacterium]